jgi:hypothetical protein
MLRSQPFRALPLQSFQPGLHVVTQPVAPQVEVPLMSLHASPQARQFVSVPSCISQPFVGSPSQF